VNLTRKAQKLLTRGMSLEDALPTTMPVYVNSVVYLFGVMTLSALGMISISGGVIALFGPTWYHVSAAGRFFNSLHFWGVQIFFLGLVMHMIGKFFMAAWRHGRWRTWIGGIIALGIAVFTGLTGFIMQTDWDAQWISGQSKDAMNAMGIGSFLNMLNTGQVTMLHILFFPILMFLFIGLHIAIVRHESPVKPIEANERPGAQAQ
jgi:quinol-cytochrome oxidoreductase complex cytochrome b subunit